MNKVLVGFASIVIGYLAGSVSFSRVVTKLVAPTVDLEETLVPVEGTEESIHMHAVSATSVRFKLGPKFGLLSSFLDMAKVAIPVALFHYIFPGSPAEYLAAIGGVIGNNWPLYHKFNGGYGQSAIYGGLLVLEWTALPVTFFGTAIFYLLFRQVHIASIAGILILIPWFWYRNHGAYGLLYTVMCSAAYSIRCLPDYLALREIEGRKSKPDEKAEAG